ncbi:AMP-binding protein [Nocardioides nanhaiensis]|uniref:Long-chain-fatty-acid--CoA ligase n=1 Tax=Nocardioides nanhaiensis TaxID=1476871 RepID=A0ABP8X494_9ACTN
MDAQPTTPAPEHATTASLLLARAEDDAPGLLFEERTWSWREVVAQGAVRAAWLTAERQRTEPRSERPWHVGVLSDNTPEYLFLLVGAALSGATLVGVNPTRRGAGLAADLRATDVDLLLVDPSHSLALDGVDHGARRVVMLDGDDSETGEGEHATALATHAHAPVAPSAAALDPTTTLMLLFTSGSTGAPKAVVCSTGRFAVLCQLTPLRLERDDVAYNAMPMFHGNALMASWGPCLPAGATWALRRRFSASGFLEDLLSTGATYANYVGRSLAYVLAQPEDPREASTRLRFVFGTEASARDQGEFTRRYGCPVVESYGSSEGVCSIRRTAETPPGALGVPGPGTPCEVRAPDGSVCPPARLSPEGRLLNADEAVGEIVAVGAAARFEGYYAHPAATADKVRGDDVHTGDLAYVDEQGWFWFAGRTADWLRVDSENFAAAPVERVLARLPGVALAAVYPAPDPRTGDRVMACLQLDDASAERGLDPAALAAFVDAQPDLHAKARPTLVRVSRQLPVTATRKVDKPRLRRELWTTADPVWEWDAAARRYRPLDDVRRRALEAAFAEHGREGVVSRPALG